MSASKDDPFATARRGYVARLPGVLAAMAPALASLRENPSDKEAGEELRSRAHKLKGTAGAYGLAEISDVAARLEEAARSAKEATGSANDVRQVETLLAEVRRAVAAAGATS